MNNLSLKHLQAFTQVADSGSFTQAAQNLHVTQSTLTAQVQQLEQQVGVRLFDRTTRRVLLTVDGARFLPVAQRLINDFDTALSDLKASADRQQGHVGIAASPSVVTRLLPTAIQRFHQQHPAISLYIRDDGAGIIEQRVLDNEVDFGIAGNRSRHTELSYQPLLQDSYGIVVGEKHPLATATKAQWCDLEGEELIMLSRDNGIRAQVEGFRQQGLIPANQSIDHPLIEVSNPAGLAALIEQALGIAIIPSLAADTSAFAQLRFIPLENPAIEREICLITRRGRSLTPAAQAAVSTIVETFHSMPLPNSVWTAANRGGD